MFNHRQLGATLIKLTLLSYLAIGLLNHYGKSSDTASSLAPSPSSSQKAVVSFPNWWQNSELGTAAKHSDSFDNTPFEGRFLHQKDTRDHGFHQAGTLEMWAMQANLQWHPPISCKLRTGLATVLRQHLLSTSASSSEKSPVGYPQRVAICRRLARFTMGEVTKTSQVTEKQKSQKGKGKGKAKGRDSEEKPALRPPPLATMAMTDPPWLNAAPSGPSTTAATLASQIPIEFKEDPKDKQMKTLLSALKKHNEDLPPDVQALVKEATIRSGQQEPSNCILQLQHMGKPRGNYKKRKPLGTISMRLGDSS